MKQSPSRLADSAGSKWMRPELAKWFQPADPTLSHTVLVGVLALILALVWLAPPDDHAFEGLARYNWLHMTLETVAIVVAGMVFGVAWNAYSGERPGNILILACGLLATGILDFVHALSYAGMPDLFTPSGPEKAINFWLAARFAFALTLAAVALRPWRPLARPALRYALLTGTLLATAVVIWVGLVFQDALPRTFIPGEGLTDFKIGIEIFLIALLAVPAALFMRQAVRTRKLQAISLCAAALISILSEMCFTQYEDVTDIFNLLGHVYKVVAFFLVYQSVFVGSVREPFVRMVRAEAEARFKQALLNSHVTVFEQGRDLRYVWMMNPAFDMQVEGIVGRTDADLHDAETAAQLERIKRAVLETGEPVRQEVRIVLKDGASGHFDLYVEPSLNMYGGLVGIVGTAVDVTESKRAQDELQLAALVYHNSSEAMLVTDESECIIAVNTAFERVTGYRAIEVLGRSPSLLAADDADPDYRAMRRALEAGGSWRGELWFRHKGGASYAVSMSVNSIFDADGSVHRRVGLFFDITEKKRTDEMIWQQANFDALTGLPNRRMFGERLKQEMRKSQRAKLPLALMFLDLDGFKFVNDTLGHEMGDVLLREAAERLRRCVRATDTVARLGGDEFTVVLTELHDPANIEGVARNILRQLSDPFRLGQETAYVSASIGIALYPQDAAEAGDLIRSADQAMYAAKQSGKNQLHYFTPAMQMENEARSQLAGELRCALQGNQFRMLYQPVVELATGEVRMVEALVRWQHPTRGLISPADFLSVAEDARLMAAFGNWIFQEAVAQVAQWRTLYVPDLAVSVNLSAAQLRQEGIDMREWLHRLRSLALPAEALVLEITEGLLLDAGAGSQSQLLALRDAGIRLAIDDFGTGPSLLPDLQRFGIGFIKIDRSLVGALKPESDAMALCEAVVALARQLDIRVIAEGVETETQREALVLAGCDLAQGYLFAEALTPEAMTALLQAGFKAGKEAEAV